MENNEFIIAIIIISVILLLSIGKLFFNYLKLKYTISTIDKIKKIKGNYSFLIRYIAYILFVFSIITIAFGLIFSSPDNDKNNISSNTNIVFVLDVSKSMNSIDINKNRYITTRLDFSKEAIKNYISKHPYYKYGLVIFTKQAQAITPLTNDINTFTTLLEGVDYRNLTEQGTNFTNAIKLAIERFKHYKGQNIIVIISDGGDPGDYKSLNISIPSNIKIFIFGVGSKKGGKILLGKNDFGEYIFEKYRGNYVITKLNEENLKQLAKDINALYFTLDKPNKLEIINKYIKNNTNLNTTNHSNNIKKINIFALAKISLFLFLLSYALLFLELNTHIIKKNYNI